jgi:peptidoglycan/LPS O-acetylase OafA/YrhL
MMIVKLHSQRLQTLDEVRVFLATRVTIFVLAAVTVTVTMSIFWRYSSFWSYPLIVIMWRTLLALALAFALVVLFTISLKVTGLPRTLPSPLFYLGTISYGIYLWHLPVLLSLKTLTWISPSTALICGVALTCVFASGSWHLFEKPIMKKLRNKPIEQSWKFAIPARWPTRMSIWSIREFCA